MSCVVSQNALTPLGKQNSLTPLGNHMNFRIAHDQVVVLETVANL